MMEDDERLGLTEILLTEIQNKITEFKQNNSAHPRTVVMWDKFYDKMFDEDNASRESMGVMKRMKGKLSRITDVFGLTVVVTGKPETLEVY